MATEPRSTTTAAAAAPSKPATPADARAAAEAKLDEDDKAREDAAVKDGQDRLKVKPTPSQRESDLARLGAFNPDDREPSGAPPEPGSAAAKKAEKK